MSSISIKPNDLLGEYVDEHQSETSWVMNIDRTSSRLSRLITVVAGLPVTALSFELSNGRVSKKSRYR